MACPQKHRKMCTFYQYYSGELKAPIPTIFIGGNHEASNYLTELWYGGWAAPNIYYLGNNGVVNFGGLTIGGISGIFKGHDFYKGWDEQFPLNEKHKRSIYHYRDFQIWQLKQMSNKNVDIFLSHDWPNKIVEYGNKEKLLKWKPFFQEDISKGQLGSPPCQELLKELQPKLWFSAHLHCKFPAIYPHDKDKKK
eukprot:UN30752